MVYKHFNVRLEEFDSKQNERFQRNGTQEPFLHTYGEIPSNKTPMSVMKFLFFFIYFL